MDAIRVFDTTGQDWVNYLSHEVSGNGMICLVALLSDKPDAATLRKATEDLIDLQPVLGCRFDEAEEPPVWVPVGDKGLFREMTASTLCQGIHAIMQRAMSQGRQMEVVLLLTPDQSAVCLRFDHAAIDGGGAKRCLALLARCYQRRCGGHAETIRPSLDRSDEQIYARCGLSDYRLALKREKPSYAPIATVAYSGMEGVSARYRWTTLSLSDMKHADGGTINDSLLAAYILALSETREKPCSIEIHMTADLRRFLNEDAAPLACNLSGMASVRLRVDQQATYQSVLAEVQRQTALLKSRSVGLESAATTTYLRTLPYRKARAAIIEAGKKSRASGVAAPMLSNLGQIAQDMIAFGDCTVTGITPLLPAMHAPAFMLGASGYNDALTLSAGYYSEERTSDDIIDLLNRILRILER